MFADHGHLGLAVLVAMNDRPHDLRSCYISMQVDLWTAQNMKRRSNEALSRLIPQALKFASSSRTTDRAKVDRSLYGKELGVSIKITSIKGQSVIDKELLNRQNIFESS